jgi:uncharacterized protein (TIGR02246 family)
MTTPDHEQMVRTMCAQVDAGDADGFAAWFADDASYTFGNSDPISGPAAIRDATAGAAAAFPWLRHSVDQVAQLDDQLFCRFTIHTEAADGREVRMPCVTVIWMEHGQIVDYRVHVDLAPAFAAA